MNGAVQISCLGQMGRFGNQLFQYAFARSYAREIGAELQTPDWIGRRLFGLDDAPITDPLLMLGLDVDPDGQRDVDLYGYFQRDWAYRRYTVSDVRGWFRFLDPPIVPREEIAIHLRRGDYLSDPPTYAVVGIKAYWAALAEQGFAWSDVRLVAEETPSPGPAGAEFLTDFCTLMNADVLFRANSTFSVWAGILGTGRVFAPVVQDRVGPTDDVEFVEGNWPKCVGAVDDYRIAP